MCYFVQQLIELIVKILEICFGIYCPGKIVLKERKKEIGFYLNTIIIMLITMFPLAYAQQFSAFYFTADIVAFSHI